MRAIPWQPEEDQALHLAYGKMPTAELARMMARAEKAVVQRAGKLGIAHSLRWTAAQDAILRSRYANEVTANLARHLGRKPDAVFRRARALGLSKSAAFYASDKSARIKRGVAPGSVRHQFPKGHVPANKGKRTPGYSPGRMGETQFKKGRAATEARNYVPIGTEKYDAKRNSIVRKITDDPAIYPAGRWKPVHVIVWESVNGPVSAGQIVRFKSGMKTLISAEISIDKLEMMTVAEGMRRNSFHNNYPKEVGLAIQAKAVLTRVINRHARGPSQ